MMGTGEAEGEDRAEKATEIALINPLIDDYSLKGAKGLLINITGSAKCRCTFIPIQELTLTV